jgi:hypothetical protein
LLIYPENIKHGLEQANLMSRLTGKFVLAVEQGDTFDPCLTVRVELAVGTEPDEALRQTVAAAIKDGLLSVNSEYARLVQELGAAAFPEVELVPHGDPRYFKQGAKQRWVQR